MRNHLTGLKWPTAILSLALVTACSNDDETEEINTDDDVAAEQSTAVLEAQTRFDVLLESFVTEPNVINTFAAITDDSDLNSYALAKGFAEPGITMTADHQFHIASMSKPFTAVVLLQLVEEGYFGLDDTLAEVFGELTFREIFPDHNFTRVDSQNRAVGDLTIDALNQFGGLSLGGSITIRQLTQHTHGMPDLTFDTPIGGDTLANYTIYRYAAGVELDPAVFPEQWSGIGLLEYYLASTLPMQSFFEPGTDFHYGDTGPVLASLIVQYFSQMSLAEAYRARIFEPLGMADTYLHHYELPQQSSSPGLSHRYFDLTSMVESVGNVDVDHEQWNTSIDWGGGGLVSTAADIDKFYRGLFNGELLVDASIIGNSEYRVPGDEETPIHGLGFGLQINEDGSVKAYEHGGFWGSYMMYEPDAKTSVVFTVNQVMFERYDEFLLEARGLVLE